MHMYMPWDKDREGGRDRGEEERRKGGRGEDRKREGWVKVDGQGYR